MGINVSFYPVERRFYKVVSEQVLSFPQHSLFSLHQRTCHDNQLFCPNHQSLLITAGEKFCSVDQPISAHNVTPGDKWKSSLGGRITCLQAFCLKYFNLHLEYWNCQCLLWFFYFFDKNNKFSWSFPTWQKMNAFLFQISYVLFHFMVPILQ